MKNLLFVVLLGVAGCSSSGTAPAATAPRVGGAEAKRLVAAGATLVDVRSPEEFADGHINGARNLPVGELRSTMTSLPKDRPVVVYCAVGARATTAAAILAAAGYDVHNLGAMASWDK